MGVAQLGKDKNNDRRTWHEISGSRFPLEQTQATKQKMCAYGCAEDRNLFLFFNQNQARARVGA